MDVPQLWDLGEDPESVLAEAQEVARAQLVEVGLADRMRGWIGAAVDIRTTDGHARRGTVDEVFRDAVLVRGDASDVVVPVSAVLSATGPRCGAVAPRGRQRASGLSVLRDLTGTAVRIDLAGGGRRCGVLAGAGADHLTLVVPGGEELVPWAAVTAAEWGTPV